MEAVDRHQCWRSRLHAQLKELSEGGLAPGISQHQNPEDDEQIRILKNDLENKVAKFQQFIIKATATTTPSVPGGGELARARTMRQFETLEHSIEGALQELECIDADPPSPAEDSSSCEESSVSDSSDREASVEAEPEEDTPPVTITAPDAAGGERKMKRLKSSGGAKAKQLRQKGEKKAKPKTSKTMKKPRFVLPKQSTEIALEDVPTPAAAEESPEADKESEEASRKLKALITKHKTEVEGWAAKLRRAKEMGLEVVSKVL
ncbi:hypothetical protein Emag_000595 [Eimeria magna]